MYGLDEHPRGQAAVRIRWSRNLHASEYEGYDGQPWMTWRWVEDYAPGEHDLCLSTSARSTPSAAARRAGPKTLKIKQRTV